MKRTIKYAVISAAVVIWVALLVLGIVFFYAVVTVPSSEPEFETSAYAMDDVSGVKVDISVGYVSVYSTPGKNVEVELVGHRKGLYAASLDGGVLTVTENETSWIDRILRANSDRFGVGIGIPDGKTVTLDISAETSAVTISSISVSGESKIVVKTGCFTAAGISSSGDISVTLETGNAEFELVTCSALSADVTAGDVFLRDTDVKKELTLEVGTGKISGFMPGPRSAYTVDAEVVTGVCDVKKGGKGEIKITAKVNEGAIAFSFAEQ